MKLFAATTILLETVIGQRDVFTGLDDYTFTDYEEPGLDGASYDTADLAYGDYEYGAQTDEERLRPQKKDKDDDAAALTTFGDYTENYLNAAAAANDYDFNNQYEFTDYTAGENVESLVAAEMANEEMATGVGGGGDSGDSGGSGRPIVPGNGGREFQGNDGGGRMCFSCQTYSLTDCVDNGGMVTCGTQGAAGYCAVQIRQVNGVLKHIRMGCVDDDYCHAINNFGAPGGWAAKHDRCRPKFSENVQIFSWTGRWKTESSCETCYYANDGTSDGSHDWGVLLDKNLDIITIKANGAAVGSYGKTNLLEWDRVDFVDGIGGLPVPP